MTTDKEPKEPEFDDSIFDDEEALIALAQKSFNEATRKAIEENDRLGIPSYGSEGGKIVVRYPPKTAKP